MVQYAQNRDKNGEKTIDNVENISEGIKDTIELLNYSGDDKNSKGMFDENLFSNMNKSFDDDDDFLS